MTEQSWDNRWMDMAWLIASWSKDRSRQVAAVIVDRRNVLVAVGWNGFPRSVDDNVEARHARPAKYQWTEHAERNALYNAAAKGSSTAGCRMYVPWFPCADCARGIIQSGIAELVATPPDHADPKWGADFRVAEEMLVEAGILVRWFTGARNRIQPQDPGYAVVPIEPTPEMVEAGRAALGVGKDGVQTHARTMWCWEAMVKAAAECQIGEVKR